jgi:hypothetical protein
VIQRDVFTKDLVETFAKLDVLSIPYIPKKLKKVNFLKLKNSSSKCVS